jgi:hypothetical protein
MNIRQQLLDYIEELPEEKLLSLLDFALTIQSQQNGEKIDVNSWQISSHAYQDWVSDDNDIYDELFN